MTGYGVVPFHTTSAVMRAEKLLVREGYSIKLIPTPRQFSSDCGISIRFAWSLAEIIKPLLQTAGVEIQGIRQLN